MNRAITAAGAALITAAVSAAASCSTARAASINFNFTAGSTTSAGVSSLTFIGVPPLTSVKATGVGGNVTQSSLGLGVSGNANDFEIDKATEAVLFDFSPDTIRMDKITFSNIAFSNNGGSSNADNLLFLMISSPSNLTLYDGPVAVGSGSVASYTLDLSTALPNGTTLTVAQRTGLKFQVGGSDGNDSFAIGGLNVDFSPAAAAPLPGVAIAGSALFAGLGLTTPQQKLIRRAQQVVRWEARQARATADGGICRRSRSFFARRLHRPLRERARTQFVNSALIRDR